MTSQTFSFSIDDQDLVEWMERQHEEGDFASRSHVIQVALSQLKQKGHEQFL